MPSVPGLEGRISARMMGLLCRQDSAGPASTSAHPLPVCACCLPPFSPRPSLHGSSASPSPTSTCPSQPVSLVPHFTLCLPSFHPIYASTPSSLPALLSLLPSFPSSFSFFSTFSISPSTNRYSAGLSQPLVQHYRRGLLYLPCSPLGL